MDVVIPPAKLALISSEECAMWVVDHCAGGVAGRRDEAGRFVVGFEMPAKAEAFCERWLMQTGGP